MRFCAPNVLGDFDTNAEMEHSRRYWSSAFSDSSWDRMKIWRLPPEDWVVVDPRSYHRDSGVVILDHAGLCHGTPHYEGL